MSVRRSLAAVPADLRILAAGAAVAGLLSACGMPQPYEPLPPPEAELQAPPELYGGPVGLQTEAPAEAYAEAGPGDRANPYADPRPGPGQETEPFAQAMVEEESRRPGWGTMEPIPNPPGSASSAYAQARTKPDLPRMAERPLPGAEERLGAYSRVEPGPPPPAYARREPPPPTTEAPEGARFPEGAPAASFPPVVVTMPPIPNPVERAAAPAAEPRVQHTLTPREEPRPRRRAAAEQRLMGAPARGERTNRQAAASAAGASATASARRTEQASTGSAAKAPAANARPPRNETRNAAQKAAQLPPANTPAGRAARLKRLEGGLAQLVQRDSTLALPESVEAGRTERVTLTLPQALSETLTREAGKVGLKELAAKAEISTTLAGEGWRIEPEEPQTDDIRAGRVNSFTWRATPGKDAGALTADVDARLAGGGRFETLQLGALTRELDGAGAADAEQAGGGLGWRTIGAALLLLALLLGALFYARRRDDDVAGDGSRRRFNRRRPDAVNLTPYSPSADTDAPRADIGADPEPSKP